MKRREFLAAVTASVAAAAARTRRLFAAPIGQAAPSEVDYVVIGSGAGGGTVAARLAEAGLSVLVLEAGGDPAGVNYDVPAFHPFATEDEAMRWDFFVRHYKTAEKEECDPNYDKEQRAFWYPRAGALGGCTAHNALILTYPHPADWDALADLTADPSWRADNMRQYFEALEDCHYRPFDRWLHSLGLNPSRHGFSGWLRTEKSDPGNLIGDPALRKLIARSIENALKEYGLPSAARLESLGDPNDWRAVTENALGARYTPLTTNGHARGGTRERLREVAHRTGCLSIELNALAAEIVLDGQNRARSVKYLKGASLYQADPRANGAMGEPKEVVVRREVIVSGGAFNTPQLLMLSGIGPPDVLQRVGIAPRVPLENVGKNLQDRYEVAVVNRLPHDWEMLKGATFTTKDAQYQQWQSERKGIYTSNGVVLCVTSRSSAGQPSPDLFCYAVVTDFRGYKRGYSEAIRTNHDCLTWVVLKGHTHNVAGEVTLADKDPRVRPHVHFNYFDDGSAGSEKDIDAVVDGIRLVRRMSAGLASDIGLREELPGDKCRSDEDLRTFVRTHAWGHHASCTCKIGPPDRGGVLDSNFRVHGTEGLRVVDASVFPRIPGLFIVGAVYMIAEKASDVILRDQHLTVRR